MMKENAVRDRKWQQIVEQYFNTAAQSVKYASSDARLFHIKVMFLLKIMLIYD